MMATGVPGSAFGSWGCRVPPAGRAFGAARVPVPGGGLMWVSMFDPSQVVAWSAPTSAALAGLGLVFGEHWLDRTLGTMGPGGLSEEPALNPPALPERWRRVAVVHGVRQWSREAVDHRLVAVDEALAWAEAEVEEWAEAVAAAHSSAVVELVATLHEGRLPAVVHDGVERVAELTVRSLPEGDPDQAALHDLEASMARETALRDAELEELLAGALAVRGAAEVPATAGAMTLGDAAGSAAGPGVLVDPLTVDARVVAWDGPDRPAVTMRRAADGVDVRVRLSSGCDSDTAEAGALCVFVADPDSGVVVASAPVRADGRRHVLAHVVVEDPAAVALLGVCADGTLSRVRTDPVGRADARAEQCLLAAWGAGRLAAAGGSADARRLAGTSLQVAEQAVFDTDHPSRYGIALSAVGAVVRGGPGTGPDAPLLAERLFGLGLDGEGADDDDE